MFAIFYIVSIIQKLIFKSSMLKLRKICPRSTNHSMTLFKHYYRPYHKLNWLQLKIWISVNDTGKKKPKKPYQLWLEIFLNDPRSCWDKNVQTDGTAPPFSWYNIRPKKFLLRLKVFLMTMSWVKYFSR